jgi:C4-dicarboxylate-specific signal transduction histidine kinase
MRQATTSPVLHRFNIARHLALCFAFLIGMMVICDGVLLWQLHEVRSQVEVLKGVDGELIEALRVHGDLFSLYERLGFAARSEDTDQLIAVSETLRSGVLDQTKRTEAVFSHLPPDVKVDETVLPTIETIENTLLSHLDAIRALAASGEWADVRGRTDKQIQRLEFLSSQLVKNVARDVEEQRTQAASNIPRVEHRIVFMTILTGFVTLFIAVFVGWATALRIIELRMEARAERQQAEEALRQAQADLARANRVSMFGELTASLGHEIKQPIAAAISNAEACLQWLARDEPDLAEVREAATEMVKEARRAAEIMTRVRSLFKKEVIARAVLDVNEIITDTVSLVREEADQRSIPVRTELDAESPRVSADRVQVQQILMNLMLNGLEAMKGNEGELVIRSQREEGGRVLISVSDTGVGLPLVESAKIFDPFFTTKPQGTGMGLAISRSIVESYGGRLWAADNAPRGASFCFTLPTLAMAHDSAVPGDRTGPGDGLQADNPVV